VSRGEGSLFLGGFHITQGIQTVNFPSITNHCIIEDQEDRIVVAIRIPKSEIAGNMHFLAGLADIVPTVDSTRAAEIG
jgi:hypothetical protein